MNFDFAQTPILASLSALASLPSAPCPDTGGTRAEAGLATYDATDDNQTMRNQRIVRGLQEELQFTNLVGQMADLLVQLKQAEARIEERQRELFEEQLLAPRCAICHIAFNYRDEKGKIVVNANKSATVCNAKLGDSTCAKRQKAQEVAARRAALKSVAQTALNDDESIGD